MKTTITLSIALFLTITTFAQNTLLTNKQIIELQKSGLSTMIINKKILDAKNYEFDTSVNGLKSLSDNNVPDEIIMKIIEKQSAKENNTLQADGITFDSQGLFYVNNNNIKTEIIAHSSSGSGFKGRKIIIGVNNETSDLIIKKENLIFYYLYDNGKSQNESATLSLYSGIKSPNEGFLVKFDIVKGNRKIQIGKMGMSGWEVLIDKNDRVEYDVEKKDDNIYKITIKQELEPGEYAFLFGQLNPGTANRFYDFTVE